MQIPRYFSNAERLQFGNFYLPDSAQWPSRWVVFCPPFGEELNKSRALVADQARRLCALGYGVFVPDLHGTGDSPYDLGASCADWTGWVEQLTSVIVGFEPQTVESITLWGLRLGALLALDVHQKLHSLDPANTSILANTELVLWQPVLSGKAFMTQFLRLRTAAGMMVGDRPETVAGLRALALTDGSLEVAGYHLSSQLIAQIDQLQAEHYRLPNSATIQWFDVSRRVGKPLAPVQGKLIDHWREQGATVCVHRIDGDAFWAAQELVSMPTLIRETNSVMAKCMASALSSGDERHIPAIETLNQCLPAVDSTIQVTSLDCEGQSLVSLIHRPDQFNGRAVLLVVGGPQYRVGSHRQFMELAQALARDGYLVARFDCRGMGDSEGLFPGFESIDADISAAIEGLYSTGLSIQNLSLWGLCDAATAIGFYAGRDSRVKQLVLLNPWVRSEASLAKTKLKHYYAKRLFEKAFWAKLFSGQLNVISSLRGLTNNVVNSATSSAPSVSLMSVSDGAPSARNRNRPLIEQLHQGLSVFDGKVLLLLSGRDLTAQEFDLEADTYKPMRQWLESAQVDIRRLADADHTFSRADQKRKVESITSRWLGEI